jgi:hypothetical protein
MAISMYRASVPVFIRMLGNLGRVLDKADGHTRARGTDAALLIDARLHPGMFPFSRQVRIAADGARGCAARLAGREPPPAEALDFAVFNRGGDLGFEGTETSFPGLGGRLRKAMAYLEQLPPAAFDGAEDRAVTIAMGDVRHFTGLGFLLDYALPNFYFHVAMAYAILRHHGVDLGKQDYEGDPVYVRGVAN